MKQRDTKQTLSKNNKAEAVTSYWIYIGVAVIVIFIMIIAAPKMFGQGFSDINSQFCMNVDTDGDGVKDSIELLEKRCVCNADIPAKQFYVLDVDFVKNTNKHKSQALFEKIPERISYEDVNRIAKYFYEKEACDLQTDSCDTPKLILKGNISLQTETPELNAFCFTKEQCTIADFREDFFMKEGTYTYMTQCEIANDEDKCKEMREQACAAAHAKAKQEDAQERQAI
jgi:hypothetical protein